MRSKKLFGQAVRLVLTLSVIYFALAPQFQYAEEIDLTETQLKQLDQTVDRALLRLSSLQQRDGSFPTLPTAQPGVTCLSTLALVSAGHLPGSRPYGDQIRQAIEYALECEREPGMFSLVRPSTQWRNDSASHTAYYNQAITALLLSEVSGELSGELGKRVLDAVDRALEFTTSKQLLELPNRPQDIGGWRYPAICQDGFLSDLSVTAWQVTFLRSAKNAGFDVDDDVIEAATKYVQRLYKSEEATFTYAHERVSRGMTGAGIMAMAMLGQHNSEEAKAAAAWLKRHPFTEYGNKQGGWDRFSYSLYYCSQGMYHLGDEHFREFFPPFANMLIANQAANGAWSNPHPEAHYGEAYITSMSVLALTTHYAMLPIHQR